MGIHCLKSVYPMCHEMATGMGWQLTEAWWPYFIYLGSIFLFGNLAIK